MKRTRFDHQDQLPAPYTPPMEMKSHVDYNLPPINRSHNKGKYHPDMAKTAQHLVGVLGARNSDLAVVFGVCEATIDNWIRNYPDFAAAVKESKYEAGNMVVTSLFRRALGYSHPDVHISSYKGEVTMTPIMKHYPPDTQAAIRWLGIIFPEIWTESKNMNVDHTINATFVHKKIEELNLDNIPEEVQRALFEVHLKQLSDGQSN